MYSIKSKTIRINDVSSYIYQIVIVLQDNHEHSRGPTETLAYPEDFQTPQQALAVLERMVGGSQK